MLHRTISALGALALLTSVAPARPADPAQAARFEALFERARTDAAAVVPLLVEGSRMMQDLEPEPRRRMGDTLEPFARRVFFGPDLLLGAEQLGVGQHVVAKGETPTSIAARYDVGAGLLEYLNADFEPKRLRVGQKLKVLDVSHGEIELEVDRSNFRLAAWRQLASGGRVLVMFAPVGLGATDSPTPTGRTFVTKRAREPEWTDPDTRKVFGPRDPRNVLGGYWMALDAESLGGRKGIGLHGYTGAPSDDWLQKPGSHGCVRMLQRDMDRVFHLATEGTVVELR